jgi:hypothetical protein
VPELKDKVPSWSWMAYTEEIRYGTVCTDGLSWKTDIILSYTNHLCILTAPLVQISPSCRVILYDDTDCDVRHENEDVTGLGFDMIA